MLEDLLDVEIELAGQEGHLSTSRISRAALSAEAPSLSITGASGNAFAIVSASASVRVRKSSNSGPWSRDLIRAATVSGDASTLRRSMSAPARAARKSFV